MNCGGRQVHRTGAGTNDHACSSSSKGFGPARLPLSGTIESLRRYSIHVTYHFRHDVGPTYGRRSLSSSEQVSLFRSSELQRVTRGEGRGVSLMEIIRGLEMPKSDIRQKNKA